MELEVSVVKMSVYDIKHILKMFQGMSHMLVLQFPKKLGMTWLISSSFAKQLQY